MVLLLLLVTLVWFGIRYAKATVIAKEFEGNVKGIILMNPMMPDEEVASRVAEAARKAGVRHDAASLEVVRNAPASTISAIRLRYDYDVVGGWKKTGHASVSP